MAGLGPNHPANKARAAQLSEQLGVEVTPDQAQRLSTQQIAEAHGVEVPKVSNDFQVSSSDFQVKFVNALGIPKITPFTSNLSQRELKGMAPEQQSEAVRGYIKEHVEPNEFLDAIAEADPRYKNLVDIAKADPALAKALHKAVAEDPTVLTGFQQMANANGTDGLNLQDLEKTLGAEGFKGKMARGIFTKGLNAVADTDLKFDHLLALGNDAKSLPELNSFEDFIQAMKNPDQFIAVLLDGVDLPPELKELLAGVLSGLAPLLAEFVDPNGFILGDFTEYGRTHIPQIRQAGREVLNSNDVQVASAGDTTIVGGEAGDDLSGDTAYRSPASAIGRDHYANNPSSVTAEQTAGGIDAYKVKSPEAFKAAAADGTSVGQQIMDQANQAADNVVRATPQAYAMT